MCELKVKFDWFGVYPIVQHPLFVVIRAEPQPLLFVSDHPPVPHSETSVGCHILTTFQSCLKTLSRDLVLLLRHPLHAKHLFFALFVHEIAL